MLLLCFNCAMPQLNLYYGNLHSHTDYTGGVADPITAYNYARNTALIDFLAVTDHNEGLNDAEWDSTLAMANRANLSGGFVALPGYEWTSPVYNHVNVFNTVSRVSRLNVTDWNAFLQEVIGFGTAFCQFNHPGFIGSNNWDSFAYLNPQTDSIFRLIEVRNFSDDQFYIMALDNGWHVSATNNQDNHSADWGNANDCRTGIWSESLTVSDITNSMFLRRTFSTMDKNASVWLEADGKSMGSIIGSATDLCVSFSLNDSDGEMWSNIELVGNSGVIILSAINRTAQFDTTISLPSQSTNYVFVRAKQNDDDYIWSAPVFISNGSNNIIETEDNYRSFNVFPNLIAENYYLNFDITTSQIFTITIAEVSGRIVRTYDRQYVPAGKSRLEYFKQGIKNGIYIMNIKTENWSCSKKIIFI